MGCLADARQVAEPLNPFGSDVEVQMLDVLNDHLGLGICGPPRCQLGHDQRHLLVDLLRGGRDDDVMVSSQFHQALHPTVGAEDDVDMTLGVRSAVRGACWDRRHQLRAEACSRAGAAASPWGPQGAAGRLPQGAGLATSSAWSVLAWWRWRRRLKG